MLERAHVSDRSIAGPPLQRRQPAAYHSVPPCAKLWRNLDYFAQATTGRMAAKHLGAAIKAWPRWM